MTADAPKQQSPEALADDVALFEQELEQELANGGDTTKAMERIQRRRADVLIAEAHPAVTAR
jgi:hypothetical protein